MMAHRSRLPVSERIPASPLDAGGLHGSPAPNARRPAVVRHVPGAEPVRGPLRLRPAVETVPWPVVLLTGPAGAGKTHMIAEAAASEAVSGVLLLEWGTQGADSYAACGAERLHRIDHDGSWEDIVGQVLAAAEYCREALGRGEAPYLLAVDSITSAWTQVMGWAHDRPRTSLRGQAMLGADPDAVLEPGFGGWQDANDRHAELMDAVLGFPGPVVLAARGREVTEVDPSTGVPTGRMAYKTEGHKGLEFAASVVVRMRPGAPSLVSKCAVPWVPLGPAEAGLTEVAGLTLSWLLEEVRRSAPRPLGERRPVGLHRDMTPGEALRLEALREELLTDGFDVVGSSLPAFERRCAELGSVEEAERLEAAVGSAVRAGVVLPEGAWDLVVGAVRLLRDRVAAAPQAPKIERRRPRAPRGRFVVDGFDVGRATVKAFRERAAGVESAEEAERLREAVAGALGEGFAVPAGIVDSAKGLSKEFP